MKNILLNSGICLAMGAVFSLSFISCDDWTEVESLEIHTPSLEEQNPQLYADYLKDLNAYKASDHHLMMVSVDNPLVPTKQSERLTALPDSVDYVSLNHPENLSVEMQNEISKVRLKGTKVVYSIGFSVLEEKWLEMKKANPELTEEDALAYFDKCIDEKLALADSFDGVIIDYDGHSLVSLKGEELERYTVRQTNLFTKLNSWKKQFGKHLLFYGNVQYLTADNMQILSQCDYIILKTALSPNEGDLSLKALLAVQAGEDVKELYENINPVPVDRFIVCVQLPKAEDKDQVIGYWNTRDEEGNKMLAAHGAAWWSIKASNSYERKGVFLLDAQADYYNQTFSSIREVISIMNPSK